MDSYLIALAMLILAALAHPANANTQCSELNNVIRCYDTDTGETTMCFRSGSSIICGE